MTDRLAIRDMKTALSFDGVNDYVSVADNTDIELVRGFSISLWFLDLGAGNVVIIEKDGNNGFSIQRETDNTLKINTGNAEQVATLGTYNDKVWHHCVFSLSSAGSVVYIDGSIENSTTTVTASTFSTGPLYFGSRAGTAPYKGSLDEVRFFNQALTADQVKALYTYNVVPQRGNLVAEYLFDEGTGTTATDTAGSNNGTISGAVYTSEVPFKPQVATREMTHSLSFDGSNDYVGATVFSEISEALEYTIEFDVLAKDLTASNLIGNTLGASDRMSIKIDSGEITAGHYDGASFLGNFKAKNIEINKWYHVVYSFADTNSVLYIDSIPNVLAGSGTLTSTNVNFTVGDRVDRSGTYPFNGLIENVRIYNTALTATEVSNLYYNNVVPTEGLVAEYFNSDTDGAGTVLTDSVGSNDGTISGATWSTEVPIKDRVAVPSVIPHVLSFDGTNDHVEIADDDTLDLAFPFTIQRKIMPYTLPANATLLSKGSDGVYSNNNYIIKMSSGTLQAGGGGTGGYFRHQYGNNKLRINEWADLVFVYNAVDDIECYINGAIIEESTTDGAATTVASNSSTIRLATNNVPNEYFAGQDKTTRIWKDVALTADEVYDLHHNNIIPTDGLVGNWNEINDTGTTLIDNSGNGNDGTITGATRVTEPLALGDVPRRAIVPYVGSVDFDGVNDDVDCGDIDYTDTDEVTLVWEGMFTKTDSTMALLGNGKGNGTDGVYMRVFSGDNSIYFYHNGGGGVNTRLPVRIGEYYKIVWSLKENSHATVWVNGVLWDTSTFTSANTIDTIYNTFIGTSGNEADFSYSRVSNARIYKKFLTTAEVEDLYLTNTTPYDDDSSICVLNLEAKTGVLSGSSWRDVSGNANHGAITGATLSSEKPTVKRKTDLNNLVKNGDFSDYPYLVAAGTSNSKWIDGTAGGSATNDVYGWAQVLDASACNASIVSDSGRMALKIDVTDATGRGRACQGNGSGGTGSSYTVATIKEYGLKLKPSTNYIMTYEMRTVDTTATTVGIDMNEVNSAGTRINSVSMDESSPGTTDWHTVTTTFTTQTTTVWGVLTAGINSAGNVQSCYISDITLTEA